MSRLEKTVMSQVVMQETTQEVIQDMTQENVTLKGFKQFWKEEDGMGTVEVILIIVVLVGLVLVFKNQITNIITSLFSKITSQTNKL